MLDVQVHVAEFMASIKRVEADMIAGAKQALGQSTAFAVSVAKGTPTFKDRTGQLRSSITRGQKSTWHTFVKASAPHARFVEFGTKPHIIEARRGKTLRFVAAGGIFFRKRVHHPGTKPTHFMQTASDAGEHALERMIEEAINRALR